MEKKSSKHHRLSQSFHLILLGYGLLISVSAFLTAVAIFLIPADPGNAVFLGLSLQRIMLISSVMIPGILMAVFAFWIYQDQAWAKTIWFRFLGSGKSLNRMAVISTISFAAGWMISFTPIYVFADYKDYYLRLSPLIHWITFVSFVTLLIVIVEKYGLHGSALLDLLRAQKKALFIAFASLTIFMLIWGLAAWTGIGLRIVEDYWYGTGVPILGIQVVIAFVIGLAFFSFEKSSLGARFSARSDVFVFVAVWIIGAFFWIRQPLPDGFFAPGPYLPDFEFHPYSDAALFDLGSQFALIGQGINNGLPFDRVLYMGFLVFLHTVAGQNYLDVIAWQCAIYAVFPAILYLLGKSIHSRTIGIILALLAIMRGINGIAASTLIDLANPKQMLTDFPMVIFAAWFCLLLVNWLKAPGKNYLYIVWAGGAMGLAIMLRTHALFLLLFGVISILLTCRRQLPRGVLVSSLLVLGMLASVIPWGMNNDGAFFAIYKQRLEARYPAFLIPLTPTPQGNQPASSITTSGHFLSLSKSYAGDLSLARNISQSADALPVYTSIVTNFFHNLITSALILPATAQFHDLWHTIKEALPFWVQYWEGEMEVGTGIFIAINLSLISVGIGISWKSAGSSGLVPLGAFFFYNLANAFARTSGGRFITPADWIVLFYFTLGLFQIILWCRSVFGFKDNFDETNQTIDETRLWTWNPLKKAPIVLFLFLFIGGLLPFSENIFPKRYSVQSAAELLTVLEQDGYLKQMGLEKAALSSFMEQSPAFTIINGRALYPRFFVADKGLPKNQYPYAVLGFPRLGFTVIDANGSNVVVLPQDQISYFPNASDVIVLGCQGAAGIDALAVVVISEQTVFYLRQPEADLQCPLPVPVCDEDGVCR